MRLFSLLKFLYAGVLLASCAYVFRRGAPPERRGMAIIVVGSILTVPASTISGTGWHSARTGVVMVDLLVLAALVLLALRSERFWPLWVAGFQLTAVATHLAMLFEPGRVLQAYVIAQGFWAYPMLCTIVLATWRRQPGRRMSRAPFWRRFSAR